jgi:hypothetical protein
MRRYFARSKSPMDGISALRLMTERDPAATLGFGQFDDLVFTTSLDLTTLLSIFNGAGSLKHIGDTIAAPEFYTGVHGARSALFSETHNRFEAREENAGDSERALRVINARAPGTTTAETVENRILFKTTLPFYVLRALIARSGVALLAETLARAGEYRGDRDYTAVADGLAIYRRHFGFSEESEAKRPKRS